jgi:hypothetical protein
MPDYDRGCWCAVKHNVKCNRSSCDSVICDALFGLQRMAEGAEGPHGVPHRVIRAPGGRDESTAPCGAASLSMQSMAQDDLGARCSASSHSCARWACAVNSAMTLWCCSRVHGEHGTNWLGSRLLHFESFVRPVGARSQQRHDIVVLRTCPCKAWNKMIGEPVAPLQVIRAPGGRAQSTAP